MEGFSVGYAFCFVTFLFCVTQGRVPVLREGDSCDLEDGSKGVCRLTTDCPANLRLAVLGVKLKHCTFKRSKHVSCCPTAATPLPPTTPLWTTASSNLKNRRIEPNVNLLRIAKPSLDGCDLEDGTRGICRRPSECPASPTTPPRKTPNRTGLDNEPPLAGKSSLSDTTTPTPTPPPPTTTTTTTTKRPEPIVVGNSIAEKMCSEYSTILVQETKPPVLSMFEDGPSLKETYCEVGTRTLIVNGEEAGPKEFPHMAALGYEKGSNIEWNCGGSLISPRFIITAAHCIRKSLKWVRLGDLNLKTPDSDTNAVTKEVIRVIKHSLYKSPSHYNDIALLELKSDVNFTQFIRPACLSTAPGDPSRKTATATGWGKTDANAMVGNDFLMKVDLKLFTPQDCNDSMQLSIGSEVLRNGINAESMICAGGDLSENDSESIKDTCKGDSGGPLQFLLTTPYCMYSIIGLTSFGPNACGYGNSVYTKVSNYVPWIESIVWPA